MDMKRDRGIIQKTRCYIGTFQKLGHAYSMATKKNCTNKHRQTQGAQTCMRCGHDNNKNI